MDKSKVIVAVCNDYDEEKVYSAVKEAVNELGGITNFVNEDDKILVKPNFLYPAKAEKCITTNPVVIKSVLRILNENACSKVKVGDSPATGTSRQALDMLGLSGENLFGAEIAEMSKEVSVDYPEGKTATNFWLCEDVLEADKIIGVCKMKTHALERITGAVKNMYGLVCGKRKAIGHVSYPNAASFAAMMADMHKFVKPALHIMDGITAMEGNGPASGTPVDMGVLLVSPDPVAIDTVFSVLINLDPVLVPTNTFGMTAGIGTCKIEDIDIVLLDDGKTEHISAEQLETRFGKADFDVQREKDKFSLLSLWSRFTGKLAKKPVIESEKCVKCGMCVNHCPVEGRAVTFKNGKNNVPVYDYSKCIRCFCCQEICPQHAIKTK